MRLGRYVVEGKLATGGMAEVFLARLALDGGFERKVVIKRVLPQYARDPDFLRLFQQEARFASFLSHPHIAQVFDFGIDEAGGAYLVMEYVEGASLRELLRRAAALGERTDPRLICRVLSQVAEALGAVHTTTDPTTRAPLDLIHRDVSPENVLLSRQGAVKLADFGIARASSEVSTTSPDVVRGKVRYLAPEQVLGEPLSASVDVWALGVTLFEALTLQRPFPEENEGQTVHAIVHGVLRAPLEKLRPDLPEALVAVVRRCLARDPHQRFADCHDLALELERVSGGSHITARLIGNWVERLVPQAPSLAPPLEPAAPFGAPGSHELEPKPPEVPMPGSAGVATRGAEPERWLPEVPTPGASRIAAEPESQSAPARWLPEVPTPSAASIAAAPESQSVPSRWLAEVPTRGAASIAPEAQSEPARWLPEVPTPAAQRIDAAQPEGASLGEVPSPLALRFGQSEPPAPSAAPSVAPPAASSASPEASADVQPGGDEAPRSRLAVWVALGVVFVALAAAWVLRPSGPARRQVLITSSPSGATIRHNDRVLGATPWAGDLPRDEAVELVFTAPGRKETRHVLAPGDVAPVDVQLRR